jgi:cation diffusion facilitator CzcD-associated flavoprotein CzcO
MPYRVVVIGAGFGGIGMAIALKQAAIEDFVVLDQATDLGGTWRDNSYPGLTCDIPSQLYSFSFRPWRWSRRFPPREDFQQAMDIQLKGVSAAKVVVALP